MSLLDFWAHSSIQRYKHRSILSVSIGQNGLQREHYRSEITTSINNHFYMLGQAGPLCTASSGLLPLTEFEWTISGDQLVKTSVAFSLSTLVPSLTEIRLMSTTAYVNLKNIADDCEGQPACHLCDTCVTYLWPQSLVGTWLMSQNFF